MGYFRHNAVVVTSFDSKSIQAAHRAAVNLGASPTEITREVGNRYTSFMIPPDGSREGWEASREGDRRRREFVTWLRGAENVYCDFVDVVFGSERGPAVVDDCSGSESFDTELPIEERW